MEVARTLAHVSDFHLGRDRRTDAAVEALAASLAAALPDCVLVTGDLTHRGRRAELERFRELFAPLSDRLVIVPGNHDRAGDDVGSTLMPGGRVAVEARPGLHVVRLDSTSPRNRSLLRAHGEVTARDAAEVLAAMEVAAPDALAVLMLHHHVLPLPGDHLVEHIASRLGWPHVAELAAGPALVGRLHGRCDLVLHGHRHVAAERVVEGPRPLRVVNAGSSPELGVRLFAHAGGQVLAERWLLGPGLRTTRTLPVRYPAVPSGRPARAAA